MNAVAGSEPDKSVEDALAEDAILRLVEDALPIQREQEMCFEPVLSSDNVEKRESLVNSISLPWSH